MNLVAYSDSEDSDNEAPQPPPAKAPPKSFAKLVSPSTHKVKVNLAAPVVKDDIEREAPPAKKARTGGGGLNISAFLPAPKKREVKGLGKGVNLRTGAEPAFSRETAPPSFEQPQDGGKESEERETDKTGEEHKQTEAPKAAHADVKLVGNAMRFKPLSVARNGKKKKKVVPAPPTASTAQASELNAASAAPSLPPPKPKVSLFSMGSTKEAPLAVDSTNSSTEYAPIMVEQEEPEDDEDEYPADSYAHESYQPPALHDTPATQTVQSLTSDLNLSEADMRQLFGRKGKSNQTIPENIQIQSFNTDAEYRANNSLIAKGETITHNPVRGIAPGKHSLKQLVNAAATNKEALEEHFATGQRNKREAGARYGW